MYPIPKSDTLKTLMILAGLAILCSCNKEIIENKPPLVYSDFTSMLTIDKTYIVTDYYKSDSKLTVPEVNAEDTYTFDGPEFDGWVTSIYPCVEYHYNFRVYESNNVIKLDWLDFRIVPRTYDVYDFKVNEWFILRSGDTYTKYEVVNKTVVQK